MINLPEISNIVNNKESSKNNITTKKLKTTYDYFSVRIPKNCIEQIIKSIRQDDLIASLQPEGIAFTLFK